MPVTNQLMSNPAEREDCIKTDKLQSKWPLIFVFFLFLVPIVPLSPHPLLTFQWVIWIDTHILTGLLLFVLSIYPHEKVHKWAFIVQGYEARNHFIAKAPFAIAPNQHVDRRDFQIVLLAPLITIGGIIVIGWLILSDTFSFYLLDIDALALSVMCFHLLGCSEDIYQFTKLQLRYDSDATAYMMPTTNDFFRWSLPSYDLYYCDFSENNN